MPPLYPELKDRRVLVVEDEVMVAMNVEDLLTDQGCEVLASASTVEEALLRISQESPDLVILDRNLDGHRTTAVAQTPNEKSIPYVVMTGYTQGTADEPAMAAAPCVLKPWKSYELLDELTLLARLPHTSR